MKELGAKKQSGIKDVGSGIRVTTLLDPWGNAIGHIYNPYFKLS